MTCGLRLEATPRKAASAFIGVMGSTVLAAELMWPPSKSLKPHSTEAPRIRRLCLCRGHGQTVRLSTREKQPTQREKYSVRD